MDWSRYTRSKLLYNSCKIHFNSILTSTPRSSEGVSIQVLTTQVYKRTKSLSLMCDTYRSTAIFFTPWPEITKKFASDVWVFMSR